MTRYVHRLWMVIAVADLANANRYAIALTGQAADTRTFSLGVNTSGLMTEAVTHYCCGVSVEDSVWQQMLAAYLPLFPSGRWYRCDNLDRRTPLRATNSTTALARLNLPFSLADALADCGLQVPSDASTL